MYNTFPLMLFFAFSSFGQAQAPTPPQPPANGDVTIVNMKAPPERLVTPPEPATPAPPVAVPLAASVPPVAAPIIASPVAEKPKTILIPDGTKVRVRLEQQLSSATADEGQPVQLSVIEAVEIDGVEVIRNGASVHGRVIKAVPKRRMGRTGKLDFSIDEIMMPNGRKIPVRYSMVKKEGGSNAVSTGIITAGVAVLFWPAAPFFLLRHGKDFTFNPGMVFDVFTDSSFTVDLKPVPQN
jgi:hypothetical protein